MSGGDAMVELVTRAMRRDRRAFEELYERFQRVVHAVALARVGARDAADVVQDVFAEAWSKLSTLREPAAFAGWILAIARSRATDHARRQRVTEPFDEVPSPTGDPSPHVEAARVLRAIRALPETYRETLIMRLVEGLTGPEIAERTELTADSVRVNLHRGMMLLRERLAEPAPRVHSKVSS